jgi:3',5'-cyclic AMP phosphodiesterase CpdA
MSWWAGRAWSAHGKVIYVATDIHVMDSSLVIHEGDALTYYIGRDRKMLSQSIEAFQAVVDSAIIHQADVLLICGDLTKDGEKIGHERVSRMLGKALQAGLKSFVIPGNHDIRNPFAKYFDGDTTSPAEGVTAEEFASIYRDFGYGDDHLRDPNSLSYVCEPVPGLTLLAIDASQYEKNTYVAHGDARDESVVGGAIKPSTLDWLLTQADEAKDKGNQVIAMMHQQLISHVDRLEKIDNTNAIENGDSIAQLMMEHGIHVVFTGHTHWSDASTTWNANHTNSLTDITTGSTVAYPSHYRVVTVSDDCSRLAIDTYRITSLPSQPQFTQFGLQFLKSGMESTIYAASGILWDDIELMMKTYFKNINLGFTSITFCLPESPGEFASLAYRHLATFINDGWLAMQEGNEHDQEVYGRLYKELRKGVYNIMGEVIENDIYFFGKPLGRSEARDLIMEKITPIIKSLLEDLTQVGTENEDRTDDLHLNISLESGKIYADSETARVIPIHSDESTEVRIYNLQGRLVGTQGNIILPAGCYIVRANNKTRKIIIK